MSPKQGPAPGKAAARGENSREQTLSLTSIEQLKAIADPLRQQLLEQFARGPATTKQVAVTLGYQPTRLYHHVAKLERAGLIALVETRPVRGTTEKYYSAVATNIRIERNTVDRQSTMLAREIASLQVIESLLNNVRGDVAGYLAGVDDDEKDAATRELVFAQAEIEVDDRTATILRKKISDLIAECEALADPAPGHNKGLQKYRLLLGWYPKAPDS